MAHFIGIDPGSHSAGLAAINEDGGLLTHNPQPAGNELPSRLKQLRASAAHFLYDISQEGAWCVVVENPYTRHSNPSTLASFGVLLEVAASVLSCPIVDVRSNQWKARAVGNGRASAAEVLGCARSLGYGGVCQDVAVAVCCADVARRLVEQQVAA